MFTESSDDEQIIERVAALDIGKAEIVCCIRLPAGDHRMPVGAERGERGDLATSASLISVPVSGSTTAPG